MEARNQSERTQALVGSVAIHRAKTEHLTICKSMSKYKSYQWYWEKQRVRLKPYELKLVEPIAKAELHSPTLVGRRFFNTTTLRKRFKTKFRPLKSGCMLFY
jgi:hypothetical protein